MKEKTKLRVIQILCIVSLLITVFSIQKTYAKYFEQIGTTYDADIKRWVIKVNDKIIHREESLSTVMTPAFRNNVHMNNNNTLVPGREGYFEFLINYESVDVAFKFEFDIQQLNKKIVMDGENPTEVDAHLEDFEIYGYSIVEGETETITELEQPNNLSEIKPIIDPLADTDENKTCKLRVLFRWKDENADTQDINSIAGMNNYEDTQFAGKVNESKNPDGVHTLLNYNVKITFTQILQQAGS